MIRLLKRLLGLDMREALQAIETRIAALEKHTGIAGVNAATDDLGVNGR